MKTRREIKIEELLKHLDRLDASLPATEQPAPGQQAIADVSRMAIMDELSRLLREDSLAVYRSGGNLDAISMAS